MDSTSKEYQLKKIDLATKQRYPLAIKVRLTEDRIREWYEFHKGKVYISFSGGKDSTVLLHIARKIFPKMKAVFINTGLEFPEIVEFVKTVDNVEMLRPTKLFPDVIKDHGYPVISKENAHKIEQIRNTKSEKLRNKRLFGDDNGNGKLPEKWKYLLEADFKISSKCCDHLKKNPAKKYERKTGEKPITGTMAIESGLRLTNYLKSGCNLFDSNRPISNPMSFWREEDIWEYIKTHDVKISKIYEMGYKRTGCMFCLFGLQREKGETRLERMAKTHEKQYNYMMNKLGFAKVLNFIKKGKDGKRQVDMW